MALLLAWRVAAAAPLTLPDAVREALASGPAAVAVDAAARTRVGEAQGYAAWTGNPEVELEQAAGEQTLRVGLPIEIAAPARGAAARATMDAAEVRREAGRAAVGVAVATAYLEAVRAEERARVAGDARVLAARQGEAARRLAAAGEVSRVDAALLEAEAAAAMGRARSTDREALVARLRLEALMGRDPSGDTDVTGWPAVPDPPAADPEAFPAVLAADLEARASVARLTAARLERMPDVSVFGGWSENEGETGPAWGVTLELPLFAPGIGALRAASGERALALAESRRTRLELTVAATDAARTLEDARAVAAAFSEVDLAGALASAALAWEAGEVSLPD
ncbi:MAG: TolC family protein, partial [Myxococcota bacterium]